jgi:hypothetical protein
MNCDQVQERVSEYLEGLLDPGDYQAVQDHLSACARCLAEVEALSRTIRAVANLPPLDPPPGFSQKVMAHIREEAERPSIWERLFLPMRIKIPIHLVTLLIVSGLVLYLYQANQPLSPPASRLSEKMFREDDTKKPQELKGQAESARKETQTDEPSLRQTMTGLESDKSGRKDEVKTRASEEEAQLSSPIGKQELAKEGIAPAASAPKPDQAIYYELSLIPKEPVEGMEVLAQKLEGLVKKLGGEYVQPKTKVDRLKADLLLKSQTLWLIVPEDQYDQFKTELASLGKIEPESQGSALMEGTYSKTSPSVSAKKAPSFIRIKLTILLPDKPKEALPTDQPAR